MNLYLGSSGIDARITQLLPMIDSLIQNFTRRKFLPQTGNVERHHGEGTPYLFPLDAPIRTVTSLLLVDSSGVTVRTYGASEFVLPKNEYVELVGSNLRRPSFHGEFPVFFPAGENNVQLTYDSGFATVGDIPDDVQLAALRTISFYLQSRSTAGMKSERIGDYQYTRDGLDDKDNSGLPSEVKAMLRKYQRQFMRRSTFVTDSELRRLRSV